MDVPPVIREISKHPILSKVKLIAEPWDCGGLYQVRAPRALRVLLCVLRVLCVLLCIRCVRAALSVRAAPCVLLF